MSIKSLVGAIAIALSMSAPVLAQDQGAEEALPAADEVAAPAAETTSDVCTENCDATETAAPAEAAPAESTE